MHRIQQFHHPSSLDEAVQILAQAAGGAAPIAGGTEIVAALPATVGALVDLTRLGLDRIEPSPDKIGIGACVTLQQIVDSAAVRNAWNGVLAEAAFQSASRFLRNAATVGGNLASSNPAWDLVAALLATDADIHLQGPQGAQVVPIDTFLSRRESLLPPGQVITSVTVPLPPVGACARLEKLARCAHDAPIVTAVGRIDVADGRIRAARAVVGGIADRPCRLRSVEEALEGGPASSEAIDRACRDVASTVLGFTDVRATAQYRAEMAAVLLRRALVGAIG